MENGEKTRTEIRRFIVQYMKEHGYSPSFKEIGEAVGLKSKSSVSNHIKKMMDSGMIETDGEFGTPRAIRVPGHRFVFEEK